MHKFSRVLALVLSIVMVLGMMPMVSFAADEAASLKNINFMDPASADQFTVANQSVTKINEGDGLYLVSTTDAFEPCNGQISSFNPKDVVSIPVEGDWTATIKFKFSQGSSQGYYEFFGFYAKAGSDYNNMVGMRGGDGAIQNFQSINGTVDADNHNTSSGLKSASTHWFRIKKTGDDYVASWSTDGTNFTEVQSYTDTGIEADSLVIDAYSGMATGYNYNVEYLYFGDDNDLMNQYYLDLIIGSVLDKIPDVIPINVKDTYTLPKGAAGCTVTYKAEPNCIEGNKIIAMDKETKVKLTVNIATGGTSIESVLDVTVPAKGTGTTPVDTFTVTFNPNVSGMSSVEVKVDENDYVSVPESLTRKGYSATWRSGNTNFNFDTPITQNYTLTASWSKDWSQMYSLGDEYADYFPFGTFGTQSPNGGQTEREYRTFSGNSGKMTYNFGANESRNAYNSAVSAINADSSLTQEEKDAKILEAEGKVSLGGNNPLANDLNRIQQWNAQHPDQPKKYYRQHVIAWHGSEQNAAFYHMGFDTSKPLATKEIMNARLDSYIEAMFKRYQQWDDVILSWDIVNEPLDDYTGMVRNGWNGSGWGETSLDDASSQSSAWGTIYRMKDENGNPVKEMTDERLLAESEWIRVAFASARKWQKELNVHWKLYFNDYMNSSMLYEPKMTNTLKLLKPISEAGNLDGYGMQARLAYAYPTIDLLRYQIEEGLKLAPEVSFSEADVRTDFEVNPMFDPEKPTKRVTSGVEEWDQGGSGSYNRRSQQNGNTYDVSNGPVRRKNSFNANDPATMRAQADYYADLMDIMVEKGAEGKVGAIAIDGTSDSNTFNGGTGCQIWDNSGNEKPAFYAIIGAPARFEMGEAIEAGPADSEEDGYTAESWAVYAAAKDAAEALVDVRIYDDKGVEAVKAATADLLDAIEALEEDEGEAVVKHSVTFDFNYPGAPDPVVVKVKDGDTVKAPEAPVREGFALSSWGTAMSFWGMTFVMPYDFSTPVTADMTLTASWDRDWSLAYSLAEEYADFLAFGNFGTQSPNGGQVEREYRTFSGNSGKMTYNFGANESKSAYDAAVAAINADASLSQAEKDAKILEAEGKVSLGGNNPLENDLNRIQQWNADHPDQPKKYYRQHVIAWHGSEQNAAFYHMGFDTSKPLATKEIMNARLDSYIEAMFKRYQPWDDIIMSWDIVNEALDDYNGMVRNGWNGSSWGETSLDDASNQSSAWGTIYRMKDENGNPVTELTEERLLAESEWIRVAFASARKWQKELGVHWKLYYNDYMNSSMLYEPKMTNTLKMLKPISEAGNLDGYGMQARLATAYPTIEMLRNQIEEGLKLAPEVSFSEADVRTDFEVNPKFDPEKPTVRVTSGVEEWSEGGSGSYNNRSQQNGNTYDVSNGPVRRKDNFDANDPETMRIQADYYADLMDIVLEKAAKGQFTAVAIDGTSDSNTFNRNTGCQIWDSNTNEKPAFFAVIGAPNRFKMGQAIEAGPAASEKSKYTAASWAVYAAALDAAEALVDVRIYDAEGVEAVKAATADLNAAIEALELNGEEPTCQHDYKAVVTEPTCYKAGYTTYTCSKCGDSYKADEVPALGHEYKDGECIRCGKTDPSLPKEEDLVPILHPELPIFENTEYTFEERAADLVARMTLSQKASEITSQNAPAISASQLGGGALNVPATKGISSYTWWSETLHGTRGGINYPQNTTVASTWNPDLYYQESTNIAQEIRERNNTNLNFYSPTINMHRDPRWGRNEESYSEDVLLTSVMGTAWVQGLEGKDREGNVLDPDGYLMAHSTIKHYVANNNEGSSSGDTTGRLRAGAISNVRMLREYYALPYGEIIRNADVSSVMTAYSYFGVAPGKYDPSSYSSYLMDTLLREIYGLSGYITGDCDSVNSMQNLHYINYYTGKEITAPEAFAGALAHGEDLECNGGHSSPGSGTSGFKTTYGSQMSSMMGQETDKGIFTENTVDISLHRLMTARIQTGDLDGDIKIKQDASSRNSNTLRDQVRRPLVEQINREGVVMLQNTDNILPLDLSENGITKVAIVGSWQTNGSTGLYAQASGNQQNIQAGIQAAFNAKKSGIQYTLVTSNSLTDANKTAIAEADVAIVVTGTSSSYSQEDHDRTSTALPDNQETLINNVAACNPNTVVIMETCGPMRVNRFQDNVKAILWSSFGGQWKNGFGDIMAGYCPSGKVTDTWYNEVNDTGVSDIPAITDYDILPSEGKNGRTYMYYNGESAPSYPFGYGLSYTTFAYSNLKIDKTKYDANETVKVTFDVKNTGKVAGKEVTQLYVAQPDAPAALKRPIRRLEGFQKIDLEPGETKTVSMEVKIEDLAFYNDEEDCFLVDTGKYQVQVGTNSAEANLKADFTVSGSLTEVPAVVTVKANAEGDKALGIEQRLIFGTNEVVNPQLTVAMNNEKLYGYIIAQQHSNILSKESCPLPEGMEISYSSNRASVVKVVGDTIKTVAPGVATLTVTATYNGVSVSGDAVIYVQANAKLNDIKVNGETISKFSPDKFAYRMTLPYGSKMPTVEAFAKDNLVVDVEMPKSLPGTAVITCTDPEIDFTMTYTVEFKVKAPASGGTSTSIDFTDPGDASKFDIFNQKNAEIESGEGLTLVSTRPAFEDCNGQNSGDNATNPEDVVIVPVSGDWTATLEFDFSTAGAANGYYQFFGFYASEGDDFQNLAGVRGGDGAMQNFTRIDGAINADNNNSEPGLATNGTYWYQIEKAGTTYNVSRSSDGVEFDPMFTYEETGIEADAIVIDAYTGMTEGYTFTLKNLEIEGVGGGGLPSIDFTDPADASKFDVINQNTAEIESGEGLTLVATRPAFEDCNGQNSGDQATNPEDVIAVPVAGDWTATLEFDFSTAGAANGYYQFFGFYASEGEDYQNLAGIRGGDGAMQNFTRIDGSINADNNNSEPGLATNGTYWYQIEKVGTTYTCSRSSDGVDFEPMFTYEDTGIEADQILIDAYTGMTEGYTFTLKSLTFEGGIGGDEKEAPAIASISVNGEDITFDPAVKTYSFAVAKDAKAPVIAAVAGNKSTKVEIKQLDGATGIATVTGTVDTKSITYTLGFNYELQSDYFADGDYDADMWEILNKDETAFSVVPGKGLVMPTQRNDVYQDGAGWKNCFVTPAMGNWEAVTKVYFPVAPAANYQQAMLLVWQDEDNYIRMNVQNTEGNVVMEPGKETKGTFAAEPTTAVEVPADGSLTMFFKVKRDGNDYTLAYSYDGADFTNIYETTGNYADPKLGLFVSMNEEGEPIEASYEYLYVVARNGLQPDYVAMNDWAAQNAADAAAASLPAQTDKALEAAVPAGYTVEYVSDSDLIGADGSIKPVEEDTEIEVAVKVSNAAASATSEPVKVTIKAGGVIEPKACPSEAFSDAPEKGNWAHEGIDFCIDKGYMNGVADGVFNPAGNVTRAQLVTILYRVAGEPEVDESKVIDFADVEDGLWYSDAIAWASANEIVNGVGDNKFNPTGAITREQIAAIFFRYAKATAVEGDLKAFPDAADAHDYAVEALVWAVDKGIISGVATNGITYLRPRNNATRAQIATIIMRYLEGSYVCGE